MWRCIYMDVALNIKYLIFLNSIMFLVFGRWWFLCILVIWYEHLHPVHYIGSGCITDVCACHASGYVVVAECSMSTGAPLICLLYLMPGND